MRHIIKEYDIDLDEIVEFVDNDGRTYKVVHDVTGFKPTVRYALVKDNWKKVGYISDFSSFLANLVHDDCLYLESIGE